MPSGQRCSRPVRARVNRVIGTASRSTIFHFHFSRDIQCNARFLRGAALAIEHVHKRADLSRHEETRFNSRCLVTLDGESRVLARRHRHRHRRRALQKRVDFTGRRWSLRQRKLIQAARGYSPGSISRTPRTPCHNGLRPRCLEILEQRSRLPCCRLSIATRRHPSISCHHVQ